MENVKQKIIEELDWPKSETDSYFKIYSTTTEVVKYTLMYGVGVWTIDFLLKWGPWYMDIQKRSTMVYTMDNRKQTKTTKSLHLKQKLWNIKKGQLKYVIYYYKISHMKKHNTIMINMLQEKVF